MESSALFLQESALVDDGSLMYVPDEVLLIKGIDAKAVATWVDFEFVLTAIVENRILKIYVAHLQALNQSSFNDLEFPLDSPVKKKRKQKKRKCAKSAAKDDKIEVGSFGELSPRTAGSSNFEASLSFADKLLQLPLVSTEEKL